MEEKIPKLEKFKLIMEYVKWFIVSVVLVVIALIVDSGFKSRDQGLKEMTQYDKYLDVLVYNDNVGAKLKLTEFLATITTSKDLRKRWEVYLEKVKAEYEEYQRKDSVTKAKLDNLYQKDTLSKGELKTYEKLQKEKNEIDFQLSKDIKLPPSFIEGGVGLKSSNKDLKAAQKWEEIGFDLLIKKDMVGAIEAFDKSENSYPTYHQVYEISNYLKKFLEKTGKDILDSSWKEIYKIIQDKYSYGMPINYKEKFLLLSR